MQDSFLGGGGWGSFGNNDIRDFQEQGVIIKAFLSFGLFSLFLLSAVLPFVCYVIVVLPLSSFYVFLLLYLFFPASLFSCSFYPILAMFVCFRCSASSLCFRISSFSCFPVLLLYCNNNSKSNKNSNKNNKRREQQT